MPSPTGHTVTVSTWVPCMLCTLFMLCMLCMLAIITACQQFIRVHACPHRTQSDYHHTSASRMAQTSSLICSAAWSKLAALYILLVLYVLLLLQSILPAHCTCYTMSQSSTVRFENRVVLNYLETRLVTRVEVAIRSDSFSYCLTEVHENFNNMISCGLR